jgi:hypothetical protein
MNSLLSSVHDLPGAVGEHAAELASCVCFPFNRRKSHEEEAGCLAS